MAKKEKLVKGRIKITSPHQYYDSERVMRRLDTSWKMTYYREEETCFKSKDGKYTLTTDDRCNVVVLDSNGDPLWVCPLYWFFEHTKGKLIGSSDIPSLMESMPECLYENMDEEDKEDFNFYYFEEYLFKNYSVE